MRRPRGSYRAKVWAWSCSNAWPMPAAMETAFTPSSVAWARRTRILWKRHSNCQCNGHLPGLVSGRPTLLCSRPTVPAYEIWTSSNWLHLPMSMPPMPDDSRWPSVPSPARSATRAGLRPWRHCLRPAWKWPTASCRVQLAWLRHLPWRRPMPRCSWRRHRARFIRSPTMAEELQPSVLLPRDFRITCCWNTANERRYNLCLLHPSPRSQHPRHQ